MNGKNMRLARLFRQDTGRTCFVPLDHGVTLGPVYGIEDYVQTISQVIEGGAEALILHKGLLSRLACYPQMAKIRYIMHLSASTIFSQEQNYKIIVSSVEEALKLGADGVSVHVNLGTTNDAEMIKDLGIISETSRAWGMPLLAMMYTFKQPKDVTHLAHAARLAEELGADIVKIDYPGSIEATKRVVKAVRIPVLIAGGVKQDNPGILLETIKSAMRGGASGVAIGRNIFQHQNPKYFTETIWKLVHESPSPMGNNTKMLGYRQSGSL